MDDASLNGAEMLLSRPEAGVQLRAGLVLARIEERGGDRPEARFGRNRVEVALARLRLRHRRGPIAQPGDLKARFGEVAVRVPFGRDWIRLDPDWVKAEHRQDGAADPGGESSRSRNAQARSARGCRCAESRGCR